MRLYCAHHSNYICIKGKKYTTKSINVYDVKKCAVCLRIYIESY